MPFANNAVRGGRLPGRKTSGIPRRRRPIVDFFSVCRKKLPSTSFTHFWKLGAGRLRSRILQAFLPARPLPSDGLLPGRKIRGSTTPHYCYKIIHYSLNLYPHSRICHNRRCLLLPVQTAYRLVQKPGKTHVYLSLVLHHRFLYHRC